MSDRGCEGLLSTADRHGRWVASSFKPPRQHTKYEDNIKVPYADARLPRLAPRTEPAGSSAVLAARRYALGRSSCCTSHRAAVAGRFPNSGAILRALGASGGRSGWCPRRQSRTIVIHNMAPSEQWLRLAPKPRPLGPGEKWNVFLISIRESNLGPEPLRRASSAGFRGFP